MEVQTNCKGCSGNVRMTSEEIKRKYVDPLKLNPGRVVGDEEYHRRLSICHNCPSLEYGTTCRHCGCLVQVKALLADSRCPYPYQSQWK